MNTLLGQTTLLDFNYLYSEEGSSLKKEELAPSGIKLFSFRVDNIAGGGGVGADLVCRKANRKPKELSPL